MATITSHSDTYNALIRDIRSQHTVPIDELENLRKDFKKNRDIIINSLMLYAVRIANSSYAANPDVERDDIISAAFVGLINGIDTAERYPYVSLITLAAAQIKHEIRLYLEHYKHCTYVSFNREYSEDKDPRNLKITSLDDELYTGDPVYSSMPSDETVEFDFPQDNVKRLLRDKLDTFELAIWRDYMDVKNEYAAPRTVSDIARDYGVTDNCIWGRLKRSRRKLYEALPEYGIETSCKLPKTKPTRRRKKSVYAA